MKAITLSQVSSAVKGQYFGSEKDRDTTISHVWTDSRKASRHDLFIPLRGERADGHDFIEQVTDAGAFALTEKTLSQLMEPYILVDSCEQALKDLAEYYLSQLDITVVGIVGSVGKTSTKEMVASVLREHYNVLWTEGNFNNEIGLPLTVFRIEPEHEVAVLEMGISDFGEMTRLAKIARPDIVVMTNIGDCHLENLGDRDGVLKAKGEVFAFMKKDGIAILNGDDTKLLEVPEIYGLKPIYYTIKHDDKDFPLDSALGVRFAKNIAGKGLEGTDAVFYMGAGQIEVTIPFAGEHHVMNALAAACVGERLNLTPDEIRDGISKSKTIEGRSNVISINKIKIIDDCYNANPMSMKAALDVLSQSEGRTVAVLGDMGELGEHEKELHYGVGQHAAEKKIDALFLTGELAKEIKNGASEIKDIFYFSNADEMIEKLSSYIKEGDTVLVKASHFMKFNKVVEALKKVEN